MVFRKESKVDAFQRQISALRQQLGNDAGAADEVDVEDYYEQPESEPEPERQSYQALDYREAARPDYSFGSSAAAFQLESYESDAGGDAITAPEVDAQTSVVAHDTTWKGELSSSGSLHVHGIVDGALTARDDVYIAEEAEVSATITATNVIIAGQVQGTIRCEGRFEVLPRGRVNADVLAPTLVVHEGATINGQVRMGGAPAATAQAEPARAIVQRRVARNHA